MTTTTDIARRHGHTGPVVCEDCGTTERVHFGSWFNPATGKSGDFLQCCTCGIAAGDSSADHADCGAAAPLDLDAVEDFDGSDESGPEVRVFHRADGWTMGEPTPEECTSNHFRQQDGRPACTATAVWKVVEDHGMHLSIGFYCDADLPASAQLAALREGAAA